MVESQKPMPTNFHSDMSEMDDRDEHESYATRDGSSTCKSCTAEEVNPNKERACVASTTCYKITEAVCRQQQIFRAHVSKHNKKNREIALDHHAGTIKSPTIVLLWKKHIQSKQSKRKLMSEYQLATEISTHFVPVAPPPHDSSQWCFLFEGSHVVRYLDLIQSNEKEMHNDRDSVMTGEILSSSLLSPLNSPNQYHYRSLASQCLLMSAEDNNDNKDDEFDMDRASVNRENKGESDHHESLKDDIIVDYSCVKDGGVRWRKRNHMMIVMEDCGECLADHIPTRGFSIDMFCEIAMQLALGLSEIHDQRLLHMDMRPNNCAIDVETGVVKIVGLHSLQRITHESGTLTSVDSELQTKQSLAYISPEATGRINRSINYTSDLYSLGVTLYQLLTGSLPFDSLDAMELIHCHLAKEPVRPYELRSQSAASIPQVLSDIVMKLLKKNQDGRYQSCMGLFHDIQQCWIAVKEGKGDIEPFTLGRNDYTNELMMPNRLYGREEEIVSIVNIFNRILGTEKPEVTIITGSAGVGKTTLVFEAMKRLNSAHLFLSGKYDQVNKGMAYSAIINALRMLVRRVFSWPFQQIQSWTNNLISTLGSDIVLLLNLMPELKAVISEESIMAAKETGASDPKSLAMVVTLFLESFSLPYILYLDDVQWADDDSLRFLQTMLKYSNLKHSMVVLSYRDDEVDEQHPLTATLREIRKTNIPINKIVLHPLALNHLKLFLADCFKTKDLSKTEDLARLIYDRSEGNPLYCRMLVREFYDEGVIYHSHSSWEYSKDKLFKARLRENILDLMISRLSKFSAEIKSVLYTASCFGCSFPLHLLMDVTSLTEEKLKEVLYPVINAGLVHMNDTIFSFAHDRVQEALYSYIPKEEKEAIHYKIGSQLFEENIDMLDENDFLSMVSHLNKGRNVILQRTDERARRVVLQKLCNYNHIAASSTQNKFALSAAIPYTKSAIDCIFDMETGMNEDDIWAKHHDMLFKLYVDLENLFHLTNVYEALQSTLEVLEKRSISHIEKILATSLTLRNIFNVDFKKTIDRGLATLRQFGLVIPESQVDRQRFFWEKLSLVRRMLSDYVAKDNGELGICDSLMKHLPRMGSEEMITMSMMFPCLLVTTMLTDQMLHHCFLVLFLEFMLKYGYNGDLIVCLGFLNSVLCILDQEIFTYNDIYELDKFVLEIAQRDRLKERFRILQLHGITTGHWFGPISRCKEHVEKSLQLSKKIGEGLRSGFSAGALPFFGFSSGDSIPSILKTCHKVRDFCRIANNADVTSLSINVLQQELSILTEISTFNDREMIREEVKLKGNLQTMATLVFDSMYRAIFLFILDRRKNLDAILDCVKETKEHVELIRTNYAYVLLTFISCLALIQDLERTQHPSLRTQKRMKIDRLLSMLHQWSDKCPDNFENKYLLACAELSRVEGQRGMRTIDYYDRSIDQAEKYSLTWECALANELAASFWCSENKPDIGHMYLKRAYKVYKRWGAKTKIAQLSQDYPNLFPTVESPSDSSPDTDTVSFNQKCDLYSVIKSSQFISSSIDMKKLLYNTMKTLIEVSGAQRGACILDNKVEAEYNPLNSNFIETLKGIQISEWKNGCIPIIEYVTRSKEPIVIGDVSSDALFSKLPYIMENKCKSIICLPILRQSDLKAVLYLENNLITNAFNLERMRVLTILASQMAIALENAMHFKAQVSAAKIVAEMQRQRAMEAENYQVKQEVFTNHICDQLRNPLHKVFELMNEFEKRTKSIEMLHICDEVIKEQLNSIDEAIEAINICTKHQNVIINDVLTLSRLESHQVALNIVPFRATRLLNSAVKMFEASIAQKQLILKIEKSTLDPTLYNDSVRISQVLINLLSNAVKFSKRAGTIKIACSVHPSAQSQGQYELTFSVKDTGIGMTEEEVAHSFDRFSQSSVRTWSSYGGSGLGLFISKNLCELMGGHIRAESVKDQWTRFTFTVTCPGKMSPTNEP